MKTLIEKIILTFYFPFIRKIIPESIFRYAACGGGNLVLDISLYALIYNFVLDKQNLNLGIVVISPHIAAFILSFCITFFTGFWLMNKIAFAESPLKDRTKLFRYMLTVSGSILINYVGLKLLVEEVHLYPTPSKILTTAVAVIFSYIMQRNFTFSRRTQK